jgi:hypothetical protein
VQGPPWARRCRGRWHHTGSIPAKACTETTADILGIVTMWQHMLCEDMPSCGQVLSSTAQVTHAHLHHRYCSFTL